MILLAISNLLQKINKIGLALQCYKIVTLTYSFSAQIFKLLVFLGELLLNLFKSLG